MSIFVVIVGATLAVALIPQPRFVPELAIAVALALHPRFVMELSIMNKLQETLPDIRGKARFL